LMVASTRLSRAATAAQRLRVHCKNPIDTREFYGILHSIRNNIKGVI